MPEDEAYETALALFIEEQVRNPNVVGILVAGSYLTDQFSINSDIDVNVVTRSGCYRERGNRWIHGVEIEYFINSIDQIQLYLEQDARSNIRATSAMFAEGSVFYERDGLLQPLIRQARSILKKPCKTITRVEREIARYAIDDLRKDLEDTFLQENWFAFSLSAQKLLDHCVDHFLAIKRACLPKPKQLKKHLHALSPTFARYCDAYLSAETHEERYETLLKLVCYTEKQIGGRRPKEWKLRTKTKATSSKN